MNEPALSEPVFVLLVKMEKSFVGLKGNLSLLETCLSFFRGLKQMEGFCPFGCGS